MSLLRRSTAAPRLAPGGPNLARRPFVNRRPVSRVALLLFAAAAVLLVVDLWLYLGYARARQASATELRQLEARIEEERAALTAAEAALTRADVEHQNEVVAFMNRRIAERTFGWSVLFDRLAEILPGEVRLLNLTPRFAEAEDGDRSAPAAEGTARVELAIQGAARDGEAILELMDALFADPAFEGPNLSQEARNQGEVSFSMTVAYLPEAAEALAEERTPDRVAVDAPVAGEAGDTGTPRAAGEPATPGGEA